MGDSKGRPWRIWSLVIFTCLVALLTIAGLIYFTERDHLKPGDTIQIVTLVILVVVTLWYAISTDRIHSVTAKQVAATQEQASASRQQATISEKALEATMDAEKNAVMPIIAFARGGTTSTQGRIQELRAAYHNIGKGPALNLRVWLNFRTDHSDELERSGIESVDVIGTEGTGYVEWQRGNNSTVLPETASAYDIVAEFSDIYERHFRCKFSIFNEVDSELSFERITKRTFPLP